MTAHENDPFYGWGPPGLLPTDPNYEAVPYELVNHYKEVKPQRWGYVCPSCHYIWPVRVAGMPGTFTTHLAPVLAGKPCILEPIHAGATR